MKLELMSGITGVVNILNSCCGVGVQTSVSGVQVPNIQGFTCVPIPRRIFCACTTERDRYLRTDTELAASLLSRKLTMLAPLPASALSWLGLSVGLEAVAGTGLSCVAGAELLLLVVGDLLVAIGTEPRSFRDRENIMDR